MTEYEVKEMEIQKVLLNTIKKLSVNVRYHPEAQIKQLARSLSQFGQTRALVIDEDNNILIGNGMYDAMVHLNWTEADAYTITGLSEKDKKKLILSDNKVYELGMDDQPNIELFIKEITSMGDFDIAGFDPQGLKLVMFSEEEATTQANNYGVVSSDVSQSMDKSQERINEQSTKPEWETNTPLPPQPTTQRKSIVCPKCGEVIYID
jgi:hypothetical protein